MDPLAPEIKEPVLEAHVFRGLFVLVDMPARQTFVTELVGKKNTMNAVALNSALFNTARIVGPALAGLIMGYTSIAFCFFLNSLSFLATIIGLLFVKPTFKPEIKIKSINVFANIKDGLLYTFNNKTLFKTVVTVAIVATFAMNFSVLIPVFTKIILKGKETGFGFLMSWMGIGSLCGALGVTMTSFSFQCDQDRDKSSQKNRSDFRSLGRQCC